MRFWSYESLFCPILYRWRYVFQWARVRYFCFCITMPDKETWRKDCWSIPIFHMFSCLVSIHSKMSKCQCPRVVQVLRWALFVRQIFVPPHSEFEQHMYRSDPRPDTVSLMQLESRRAVPQASRYPDNSPPRHSPYPKPQPGHLIPQLDGCEVKNHCRLQDHAHFSIILLFLDSRPEAVSRSAALFNWQ